MAKAHFSRRARLFMVLDTTSEDGFDAYPVEVPERTITRVKGIKDMIDRMYDVFEQNPAPEDCTQAEADLLTELLDELFLQEFHQIYEEGYDGTE